ncbi:MAG: peptidoglycan-binding protein, partial [Desulfobacterales bacterium]|nr:peptidoglycan-binding protein [Desulfobacterales bacterium]
RSDINKSIFKKRKKAILFFSILSLIIFMIIYYRPGLLRVTTIFNSPGTKKLDTLHSNNVKKPVPAVTVSESKELVPAATASESKELVPAATASESKKPVPIVIASESKKIEVQKVKTLEPVIEPITEPARNLGNLLETMNRLSSRHMAIKVALNLWDIEPEIKPDLDAIDDDQDFFRLVSKENNLLIRPIKGNLNAIKKLNLPVILAVHLNKGIFPVYLTLIKIDTQKVALRGGKQDISIELSPVELESYWSGVAYIPWKNFLSLKGTIPIDCPKDSITTLKMLLRDIGFKEIEINPFYDDKTRQAVKEIQKKYGLHIDGTVGSTTKIALYNEKKVFKQPHIVNVANSFVR